MGFIDRMRQVAGQGGRRVARLVAGSVGGRAARRMAGLANVGLFSCSGATTAEYALILALIVIALMGTLGELRDAVASKLQEVIQELTR